MAARPFAARRSGATAAAGARVAETGSKRAMEAAALGMFALSLFLALSLMSFRFDPHDPRISGPDWMGPVGAALAHFFVQGFGLAAWLVPVELAALGTPLIRGRATASIAGRLSGDVVVLVILSALVQVAAPELVVFGRAPSGGNVGLVFGELMRGLFSTFGSFLVGPTIVGLILIGRSSFSFIAACRRAAEVVRLASKKSGSLGLRLIAAWKEARALRREVEQARLVSSQPRIETRASDEAIILQLTDDDAADWIPIESTGTPPLALSSALKQARQRPSSTLLESSPTAASAPVAPKPAPVESSSRDAAATPATKSDAQRPAAPRTDEGSISAPRIVDTQPNHKVERDRSKKKREPKATFKLPATDLLEPPPPALTEIDRGRLFEQAGRLEKTLFDYGVSGRVEEIHPGPTVTTFEIAPEAGTKVSRVAGLSDDLALGLSRKVRIIAPIPGKSRIGFELPNDERVPVNLRELIEDKRFEHLAEKAPLPVVLGRDHVGAPFYADLASMPHVIVAGATGAGKSVGLNVMLSSLLFCRSPELLRFLMIDPKVVELAPFDGIPHMLLPVVTDMKQAATALRWAVNEMERRYQLFANAGTKNIVTYNQWVARVAAGELPAPAPEQVQALAADGAMVTVPAARDGTDGALLPRKLPFIVIVVDEFADLMMQQGKEVEASVARLAQKARAAGMHVVLATQRPSVDVITGMIKANFPSRIAFRVAQKVDSRTILDDQGAELLLGKGDMLVKLNGSTDTRRVQCPFVSEEEVSALVEALKQQGSPEYHEAILEQEDEPLDDGDDEPVDSRFDEAVRIVAETQRCSTSWLQRKMTIGYNRAAKIVEMMEKRGMVGPPNGARDREVLIPPP